MQNTRIIPRDASVTPYCVHLKKNHFSESPFYMQYTMTLTD